MSKAKKIKKGLIDKKINYAFTKVTKQDKNRLIECKDVYCDRPDSATIRQLQTKIQGIFRDWEKFAAGDTLMARQAYLQYMRREKKIEFRTTEGQVLRSYSSRSISATIRNQLNNSKTFGKGNKALGGLYYQTAQKHLRAKPAPKKRTTPSKPKELTPEQELWKWTVRQAKEAFNQNAPKFLTKEEASRVRKIMTRLGQSKYDNDKWELLSKMKWHYNKSGDPAGETKRQLKMWECIENNDCGSIKALAKEANRIYTQWDWNEKIAHLEEEYEMYIAKLAAEGDDSTLKPAIIESLKKIFADMYEAGYHYGGENYANQYMTKIERKAYARRAAKQNWKSKEKVMKWKQEQIAKRQVSERKKLEQKFREKQMKKKIKQDYKKSKKKKG